MSNSLSFWEKDFISNGIDIAILGAGIVGLSSAYFLKQKFPDKKIIVLERAYPGMGASTKNAGFACFGSPTELMDDLASMSKAETIRLLKMRYEGLETLKSLVPENKMQYSEFGSYEMFRKEDSAIIDEAIASCAKLNELVEEATGLKDCFLLKENSYFSGLHPQCFKNQYEGQLNPMRMMAELNRIVREAEVPILYGSEVESIDASEKIIHLKNEIAISAEKIVISANGFSKQFLDPETIDLETVRNQVLITGPISDLPFCGTFHMDQGYVYFRTYGQRLLIGGGRHLDKAGESTDQFGAHEEIINYLKKFTEEHLLPQREIVWEHQWSGILGVGNSKMPIIKEVHKDVFLAARLGGMGVAIGSGLGRTIAEIVE